MLISSLTCCPGVDCSISTHVWVFPLLISSFVPLCSRRYLLGFQSSYICSDLSSAPPLIPPGECSLRWRGMCILRSAGPLCVSFRSICSNVPSKPVFPSWVLPGWFIDHCRWARMDTLAGPSPCWVLLCALLLGLEIWWIWLLLLNRCNYQSGNRSSR